MKPELRIFHDYEGLSRHAANLFIEQSNHANLERGRFLVALNGGSTPAYLFQLLAAEYRRQVEWEKVHVFWGDERCVPPEDPGSNYRQAMDLLLSHVPVPAANIHRAMGEHDPLPAAENYAQTLKQFAEANLAFPRFDFVLLGLGEDGHTASLFPGSPASATEPVIAITADYQDRPANRVTLTELVFNQAHMIVFMATGEKKAGTLAQVLGDRYNPDRYPAQRIDPKEGQLIWLVDDAAASKLPRKIKGYKVCEG
jgi:6-phosphogluconolactonase